MNDQTMTPTVAQPLRGIRVLEDGDDLALAFCGKYLAGLGADVRVALTNRLCGHSPWVQAYVDDGKSPSGEQPEQYDVFLTTDRDLLAPEGVVRVLVTDHGLSGPQSEWVGGELLAQAASGLAHLIGEPDCPPLQLGGHQIDYSTGLMAFTAVMIALTSRNLQPQDPVHDVQLSRLEAAAYIEWKGRVYCQAGNVLERGELSGPVVIECQDGFFGFYYRPVDWPSVRSVLDAPELGEPPFDTQRGRVAHRKELADLLSSLCKGLTTKELYHRLQSVGVPAGPVLNAADLRGSEQYKHREFLIPNTTAGHGAVQPALPVLFNGLRPTFGDDAQ